MKNKSSFDDGKISQDIDISAVFIHLKVGKSQWCCQAPW